MKAIFNYLLALAFFGCLFTTTAQNEDFIPLSLDDNDIPVYTMEFKEERHNENIKMGYAKGTTTDVESRILINSLDWVTSPIQVSIATKDEDDDIEIELVKKDWDDVVQTGTLTNRVFQTKFKAARSFGIKIKSEEPGKHFLVAVAIANKQPEMGNLFTPAASFSGNNNAIAANDIDEAGNPEEKSESNWLLILIAVVLIGILGLLAMMVFKGKKKATIIIFLLMSNMAFSQMGGSGPSDWIDWGFKGFEYYDKYFDGDASDNWDPFSGNDEEAEPDMDPRGQPNLPSSCIEATGQGSRGGSSSSGSSSKGQGNKPNSGPKDTGDDKKHNPNDKKDKEPKDTGDDKKGDKKDGKPKNAETDSKQNKNDKKDNNDDNLSFRTLMNASPKASYSGLVPPLAINFSASFSQNDQDEGCECLRDAYAELQDLRFLFEKLRIIGHDTKTAKDWAVSFGDDVSGVHAVSGLAWQTERRKIMETYKTFEKTYNNKYDELVQRLYEVLKRIDECEAKMGYENWYSTSGFIYFEFMKSRYASID